MTEISSKFKFVVICQNKKYACSLMTPLSFKIANIIFENFTKSFCASPYFLPSRTLQILYKLFQILVVSAPSIGVIFRNFANTD
ncbi:MAG: hypothetical protein IJS81_11725 [Selenomonadaceae bacterium]|nr:hypothetical protein [Selenomonadaceae bacterium]MBQ7630857.1 hypothetical protein [Selenomonadaceae bacterium]